MHISPSLRTTEQILSWVPKHLLEVPALSPERLVLSHLCACCHGPPSHHTPQCPSEDQARGPGKSPGALSAGLLPVFASRSSTARNISVQSILSLRITCMCYDPSSSISGQNSWFSLSPQFS